jgi:glycosyltransferase involved in cell wall biosynthesis
MGDPSTRVTIIGINYWPEPTGIAPYTSGLAEGLAAVGRRVQVVTAFPHYPAWRISPGYDGRRISEAISGVGVRRNRPYVPSRPAGVRRLLMELHFGFGSIFTKWNAPEALILVSPALFAVAIAQARARIFHPRVPVIVWVQDIYARGVEETGAAGSRGTSIVKWIESAVLRRADKVVVIHDRFKRYLTESLAVEESKIEVVRNWTHIAPSAPDRAAFRQKFGWGDEVVVLHAGNMGAKQALENVVDAARLADHDGSHIRFVLLGDGNQRHRLQQLAGDVIKLDFLDSLDDASFQGAMAAADILLVNEKAGLSDMAVPSKLTSYFASGRPVIAVTDVGSITSEEIAAARAGVRVDTDDPLALVREALALGNDAARSEALGSNGVAFQALVLSEKAAISQYAEIITRLALKKPVPN